MSTNLSTPWTPTLAGQECARYEPYDGSVDEGAVPNIYQDPDWALKRLEPELEKTPNGRDALWEGILALWRLKLHQEFGSDDPNWQNLMSAWLHRHKELCQQLSVAPYRTVLLYADALRATKFLPAEMIPWDQPELDRQLGSESTPKPKQKQKRGRKPPITPILVPSDVDSDIEMVEVAGPPVAVSARKGKGRAQPDFSASVSESQQSQPTAGRSKRGLQESPTQGRRKVKRARESINHVGYKLGVDLGKYSFEEGSAVDTVLVPMLKKKVCLSCWNLKDPSRCRPTWHKNGKLATVSCEPCMVDEAGCSFKDEHWDIDTWPTLTVVEAPIRRQLKGTEAKRKGPSMGGKEAGPSNINRMGVARPPIRGEGSTQGEKLTFDHVLVPPAPSTKPIIKRTHTPAPAPAPGPGPVATLTSGDTNYSVFLQDILAYEKLLSNPGSSRMTLKMKALELRAIGVREEGDSRTLMEIIQGRSKIIRKMTRKHLGAGLDKEEDDREDVDGGEVESGAEDYIQEGGNDMDRGGNVEKGEGVGERQKDPVSGE